MESSSKTEATLEWMTQGRFFGKGREEWAGTYLGKRRSAQLIYWLCLGMIFSKQWKPSENKSLSRAESLTLDILAMSKLLEHFYQKSQGPRQIYSWMVCTGTCFGLSNYQENVSVALRKATVSEEIILSEWACLPRAGKPCLLSVGRLLKGATGTQGAEAQHLRSLEGLTLKDVVLHFSF